MYTICDSLTGFFVFPSDSPEVDDIHYVPVAGAAGRATSWEAARRMVDYLRRHLPDSSHTIRLPGYEWS